MSTDQAERARLLQRIEQRCLWAERGEMIDLHEFVSDVRAALTAAPPAQQQKRLTEADAIRLWRENHEAHRRLFAFEWFAAGIIAGERAHGITGDHT